jgi:hypothetical protein
MRSDGTAVKQLFTRLVSSLGRKTAIREFNWMKQALIASHAPTLPAMLLRRLSGEPLQYILGVFTSPSNLRANPHPDL